VPRQRKRTEFAPPLPQDRDEAVRHITRSYVSVRKALDDLPPRTTGMDTSRARARRATFGGCSCALCLHTLAIECAIQDAVHDIVGGLSRAIAHPPDFFRVAGRPVEKRKGRPPSNEGALIAWECGQHFEQITGKPPTVDTDPQTKRPYGHFHDLVKAVFTALNLLDNPEYAARRMVSGETGVHRAKFAGQPGRAASGGARRRHGSAFSP
jgi:hypothetical protein